MKCRVLIAANDLLVQSALTEALASAGHSVQLDADGPSAMSRLAEAAFDVVVCDLLLGRMPALELLGAAKRGPMPAALIYVTTQSSVADAVGWLKAGADDYVTTPFDAGDLVARIELSVERVRSTPVLTLIVNHLFRRFAGEGQALKLTPGVWTALMQHPFVGSVRELEHAIQQALVLSRGMEVDLSHPPADIRSSAGPLRLERANECRPLAESMKRCERACLVAALHATHGIKFKAARLLGISRKTLWEKLKAHRIKELSPEDDAEREAGSEQFAAPA
jgi:DNA-binding NtrC family response regulator